MEDNLICPIDFEESVPNLLCQFRNCYDIKAQGQLTNTLYIEGRIDINMDVCEAHKVLMIKNWKDLTKAQNVLWEFTGLNPLTKWNNDMVLRFEINSLRIIRIVLKHICATLGNILYSYDESELPQRLLIKSRTNIKKNIAICGNVARISN